MIDDQKTDERQLDPGFFSNLIKSQQQYKLTHSQSSLSSLIHLYCDCIDYFGNNSQPVSIYFQHKMKKLLLQKRKIQKQTKIQEQVQSNIILTPIVRKLIQHQDSAGKFSNKVVSIIDRQKQILVQRKESRKKQLSKAISMDFLFQSNNQLSKFKSSISSKAKLFQNLIQDQDNLSQKYDD